METKKLLKNSLRFLLVTLGVVVLTSFGIDAADTFTKNGSQTALSIFTDKAFKEGCLDNMVEVSGPNYTFCIDKYEVSPSEDCLFILPTNVTDTAHNLANTGCIPVSEVNKSPWTFVAKPQAEQLCAKIGKSLPSAEEWYAAAMGTPDNSNVCNLNGSLTKTGFNQNCLSGAGAIDMVGNVWELVDSEVVDGRYLDRDVPKEGYVDLVDSAGVAITTTSTPNIIYNEDYFWVDSIGRFTIMRGGYYGSRNDGGIYASYAKTDNNFASAAIGFRCVERLP